MTIATVEAAVLLYLGQLLPGLLIFLFLNVGFAYLLFLWVRFTLADARRAFRWAAIAAAVCPWATYLLGSVAGQLGGDSRGFLSFGLIGTYAAAALAVATKEA